MKSTIVRIIIGLVGIGLVFLSLYYEIDGSLGFIVVTLGIALIIIALTLKGLLRLIIEFI